MTFRQFFDVRSSTYTYLLAGRPGSEALLIDPVIENTDLYLRVLSELDLRLVKAIDTHCHADHITALGELRDRTLCTTVMGETTSVDVVSMRVGDGDSIDIDGIALDVLHTPGHTDDSYCFVMEDRVFTGDTLLIRGTGRTDFQNGDPYDAYRSIFGKLLKLPDETLVYPGHDYKGETVSTIGEERSFNPRLQVSSADEYADIMNNLNLPDPKMMDEAVPANLHIGFHADDPEILTHTIDAARAFDLLEGGETLFVDLRESAERRRDGIISGSLHSPYPALADAIGRGGLLAELARRESRPMVVYCAYGERSALALKAMDDAGIENAVHLGGGVDAWKKAGLPLDEADR